MKKLTLFLNKTNTKIRFQDFHGNVKTNTSYIHEIAEFYTEFPKKLLRTESKSAYQALVRKLGRNISMTNIYVAVNETHLVAFDPSKSIMIAYDFDNKVLFAAPANNETSNKNSNVQYNADALVVSRTTVSRMFVSKEFVDLREQGVTEDLRRTTNEKNIMIEELKSLTEQYKEMQAELETLRAENKKLRHIVKTQQASTTEIVSERVAVQSELVIESVIEEQEQHTENTTEELVIPSIDSYKQSWVAIRDLMTEIAASYSQDEIEQKTKELHCGFQWFVDWKEPIGLEMAFTAMTTRPERALSTIRNAIEEYEESINKSVKVRV